MNKNLYNTTIAKFLKTKILGRSIKVDSISNFPNNKDNSISFLQNKTLENLSFSDTSTVITFKNNYKALKKYNVSVIISDNPKYDFAITYDKYFKKKKKYFIDESLKIGKNCSLDKDIDISFGVTIGDNVKIGKNVSLGKNVTINSNTIINDNVIISAGSVIGIDPFSFGFKKNAEEKYIKIPSEGSVLLEKGVQIGHNCVIAKGVFDSTVIGKFTKINDLSHIGNTVKIGDNSLLMANTDISARVEIGNDCWIAQSVCVMQGIKIGDNVQVGMGSIVTKNIKNNVVAYGQPAKIIRKRI